MLTATPPPPLKGPKRPRPPRPPATEASAAPLCLGENGSLPRQYQYKQQPRSAGSILESRLSAVNAVGTPLGRYQKQMYDAVGASWTSTPRKGDTEQHWHYPPTFTSTATAVPI